jgi:putative phosphoesterase
MKIGVISDAHGNATGVRACLEHLEREGCASFFFLGDAVGYLPECNAVFDELLKFKVHSLLGNHDAMLLENVNLSENKKEIYNFERVKLHIDQKNLIKLSERIPTYSCLIDSCKILFVHGSPKDPLSEYVYPNSSLEPFSNLPFDVVFMGHTHHPFIRTYKNILFVNVGSCGLPRDQGNLMSCVTFDTNSRNCIVYRIQLNVDQLIEALGDKIHSSVKSCFLRKNEAPVFGNIV